MSKKTEPKKNSIHNQQEDLSYSAFQGIGYIIPHGKTATDLKETYKLWNKKLKDSGHDDIESFSSLGKSSFYFVDDKTRSIFVESNYSASYYFDLLNTYLNYFMNTREALPIFAHNTTFYKLVLKAHIDGNSLSEIVKLIKSVKFYKDPETGIFHRKVWDRNKKRSKFYVYMSLRYMLNHCWLWHCTSPLGELNFQDLQYFNFLGLDLPETERIINKYLLSKSLKPVKLRVSEAKYYNTDKCTLNILDDGTIVQLKKPVRGVRRGG